MPESDARSVTCARVDNVSPCDDCGPVWPSGTALSPFLIGRTVCSPKHTSDSSTQYNSFLS